MDVRWELVAANCTGCGVCVDVCQYGAILQSREMAYPEAVPGACVNCQVCLQECPFGAIEIHSSGDELPPGGSATPKD